jgi:hypothetical protein
MRNVSDKIVEKIKTHFVFNNFFFENVAIYEVMWTNFVERGRPQMTVWLTRIAYWILKATNTHSQYVMLIAFYYNNGCTNAPQCYFMRTVHCLIVVSLSNDNS